jgi:hypothetical protein
MNTKMTLTTLLFSAAIAMTSTAQAGAGDDLMKAMKACKADSKAVSAAQSMIKKHGGSPSDKQVDDFIDSLDSDDLIDCIDDKLD